LRLDFRQFITEQQAGFPEKLDIEYPFLFALLLIRSLRERGGGDFKEFQGGIDLFSYIL